MLGKNITVSISFLVLMCFCSSAFCQTESGSSNQIIENKIDSILGLMTLSEKIGQLNLPVSGDITTGQAQSSNVAKKIEDGQVGGLFNIKGVNKIRDVQRIAVEKSRLKIPLLFGMDVIHGYETTFPIPLGLSTSWNMDLIKKTARMAAIEASADGINWTFSPMVDISRDPRWGRVSEGSGEDPYLGSQIARAMVKGYQGDDLAQSNTILSCVKHFALYGASEAGRDYNTVDMSRIKMYNDYLPPYHAAVDAGVASVMASFNEIDGVPATGNKWLLTDLLRKDWGFEGFVVTDYTGIFEMMAHGMGNAVDVVSLALNAGIDMDMAGDSSSASAAFIKNLEDAISQGRVEEKDIDMAVRRMLRAKYKLGLFDDPYKYCSEDDTPSKIYTDENREFAVDVATESMVLLKNDDQLLPLKKNTRVALVGPMGNTPVNMAGTWSVATVQERSISLFEGLKNYLGSDFQVSYSKGSNVSYDKVFETNATMFGKVIPRTDQTDKQMIDEAVKAAMKSDIIIAAIGETAEMSGESSSRTNLNIPQAQRDLLDALLKTGKPVVMVLFAGRPLVLVDEYKKVPAILNVWFPGSEAGTAISKVLFGDVNPSGKLTTTFPRNVGQIPIYYNHKNTGRPLGNDEGNFEKFKSNYIDVRNEPLFPFGYGLSYTTFSYKNMKLSSDNLTSQGTLTASIEVSNTGKYDGKEVVQMYIRDLVGSVTRPVKELKGFEKIYLKRGETKTVNFEISEELLKFYNSNLEHVSEPGTFQVFIGTDSNAESMAEFELVD